jgi:GTP cyclohydrolase I
MEQTQRLLAEELVREMVAMIGENPDREGLLDTPKRVVKSWKELYAGYQMNPGDILKTSFAEKAGYDQMVVLRDIDYFSTCEHHLLPFFGRVHVAYIPGEAVVGISKLARLVECFARRLQIQEVMTSQIADSIMDHLKPHGVGVMVEGQHFCMTARGVKKQEARMVTSALRGDFLSSAVRQEFFSLVQK